MIAYAPLLAVLVALLVGLAVGKAWERYKLRDGRWIDRRRLRETPHYMLGLNFLVDNQVDQAIDELTQATSTDTDALEIQMILGNLYRQKGQVGRAINVHQALLQRTDLRTLEHAYVLLCLGLDYRHGGFVDRALEAFQEVVRLDPTEPLRPRQPAEAATKTSINGQRPRASGSRSRPSTRGATKRISRFSGSCATRWAAARPRQATCPALRRRSRTSSTSTAESRRPISTSVTCASARATSPRAVEAWESLVQAVPDRAYLAFERLERAYRALAAPQALCRTVSAGDRPRPAGLASASGPLAAPRRSADITGRRFDLLLDALPHNPHGLVIHQELWQALSALGLDPGLVRRYVELTRDAVFYLDPHVCVRCRYRSTELLWQCPQCHEWNTFVEERIAPAKDTIVAEMSEGYDWCDGSWSVVGLVVTHEASRPHRRHRNRQEPRARRVRAARRPHNRRGQAGT